MKLPAFNPVRGFIAGALFAATLAAAAQAPVTATPSLPSEFGGWHISGTGQTSNETSAADPVNGALLREYGFTDVEHATYRRPDGRKLTLKAARFADASGAYGAFTYYRMPEMLPEKIGDQGASLNQRILFYRGNILLDADFQQLSAMSAAELRELANDLTVPTGGAGKPPSLPEYLPPQSRVNNSIRYVLGPMGLQAIAAPVSADLVGFDVGAEVVTGHYNSSGGDATLMLISYPTPQIAADRLRKIDAAQQVSASNALSISGPIFAKRSGPIVAVASGPLSQSEARSLLAAVNYEADVTWNENTYVNPKDNLASLLVNIILLSGIIGGLAIVAGIAFGGIRILVKRFFPDKVFDRPEDMELISLHLSESDWRPPTTR